MIILTYVEHLNPDRNGLIILKSITARIKFKRKPDITPFLQHMSFEINI